MFRKAFFLIALMALAMAPRAGLTIEPSGPSAPVRLEIVNATAAPRLLCRLVLAHFVTQDLAPIGPAMKPSSNSGAMPMTAR
jgi:hypothetical protein